MKPIYTIILILLSISFTTNANECLRINKTAGATGSWGFPADTLKLNSKPNSPAEELEAIYSLLSYAVVFKNWQQENNSFNHQGIVYSKKYAAKNEIRIKNYDHQHLRHSRGHNFGAILVNPENEVVHWARNNNHAMCDETQHGETRLIQQYLSKTKKTNLNNYKIFVTGDSCPMCAGMISQQKIKKAILGLSNPFFGRNFDRMNFNSFYCKSKNGQGLKPVLRSVKPMMANVEIRLELDKLFRQQVISSCLPNDLYNCKQIPSQTIFLKSDIAHQLFDKATYLFFNYKLIFPERVALKSKLKNKTLYKIAVSFLRTQVSSQPPIPNFHNSKVSTHETCKKIKNTF